MKKAEWQAALQRGAYEPASLASEGFVHCSKREQTVATANRFFRAEPDLVLLCIEPQRLTADLRLEAPANRGDDRAHELFPHVYGPINLDAVTKVVELPCEPDDSFRLPSGL